MTAVEFFITELTKLNFDNINNESILLYIKPIYDASKEMERDNCKKMYEHATFSILEHGHGETFEEYWNRNFKSE